MKGNKLEELPAVISREFNAILSDLKRWGRPEQLYRSLLYRGDFALLIGPPGSGKSIYAVMIAEELCKKNEVDGYKDFKVLYIDLEMSKYQLQMRLRDDDVKKTHKFPEQLERVTFIEDDIRTLTVNNMLYLLAREIEDNDNKVEGIIIDNLTCLCKGKTGAAATVFMQKLKLLRDRFGINILVVAHTQNRNGWKPIALADLNGNTLITAIVDSIFALNMSRKGKNIRYVKQLKSRCSEIEYGQDNVMEYIIGRDPDGMLRLIFQGTTTEEEQIDIDYEAKQKLEDKIKMLNSQCMSIREIANELKISPSKVWRCLNREK